MKLASLLAALVALLSALLLVIMALWPVPAAAQGSGCVAHDVMLEQLADRYGERRISVSLDRAGNMVEVWANLDSGSWSITVTTAAGPTCLVASGQAFELVDDTDGLEG